MKIKGRRQSSNVEDQRTPAERGRQIYAQRSQPKTTAKTSRLARANPDKNSRLGYEDVIEKLTLKVKSEINRPKSKHEALVHETKALRRSYRKRGPM